MPHTTVLSLGGSIVVPDGVDSIFVAEFVARMTRRLDREPDWRLALIVGGGSTARSYQKSAREIRPDCDPQRLDEIGIASTRVNAQVIRSAFGSLCEDPIVLDPSNPGPLRGRVIVGGGWKPGFSTDNVAVRLAQSLGAGKLINLSNISRIYNDDPSKNPDAIPLEEITWSEFRKITGDEWIPGKNTPFDPVATKQAAQLKMTVITADGRDLDNLDALLDGRAFVGTTVGPE